MTVPAPMADVLDDHVVFELDCIDRMYLNLYQPKLMYVGGVIGFFKGHRGMPFASSALMDPMTTACACRTGSTEPRSSRSRVGTAKSWPSLGHI